MVNDISPQFDVAYCKREGCLGSKADIQDDGLAVCDLCEQDRNKKKRSRRTAFLVTKRALHSATFAWSGCFEVAGRRLATLGDDVVADALTFGQRAHAGRLNRTDVYENIVVAGFRLDESKPLGGVKPFNSSYSHVWPP